MYAGVAMCVCVCYVVTSRIQRVYVHNRCMILERDVAGGINFKRGPCDNVCDTPVILYKPTNYVIRGFFYVPVGYQWPTNRSPDCLAATRQMPEFYF